jgi:transposase InsO family protein
LRRADLREVLGRYRRLQRRRRQRYQCRLLWLHPGTVWAADFKQPREPLEGRYGWILSIKDLASRYQLAWEPVVEATAEVVQASYARLFAQHGRPLVIKSDNGGPFQSEDTKRLLAQQQVLPLYSPNRHPQYNGGVERANGQLAGYQQALAEFHGRGDAPTCADAAGAQQWANDLARPHGWRGPTARELFAQRMPLSSSQREAFGQSVQKRRDQRRAQWQFDPQAVLTHNQSSAIDRRAIRDALLAHGLLEIHPRRRPSHPLAEKSTFASVLDRQSAGRIDTTPTPSPPMVGEPEPLAVPRRSEQLPKSEEVHYSTNSSSASGQI